MAPRPQPSPRPAYLCRHLLPGRPAPGTRTRGFHAGPQPKAARSADYSGRGRGGHGTATPTDPGYKVLPRSHSYWVSPTSGFPPRSLPILCKRGKILRLNLLPDPSTGGLGRIVRSRPA